MKGETLYLECNTGISGDMTVAALLDLGADQEVLKNALQSLPVHGFEVEISRVKKAGLEVCDFHVKLDAAHENHDHDMEYLHGHSCGQEDHTHQEHHHEHRGLPEILQIIAQADISSRAKETAIRIFEILAQAESEAHGVPIEQVHFHEVGAVDSIVDIIAAAVCLDNLEITEVIIPYVCEGKGNVRCQHGILPVPVPAVTNIVREHRLLLQITDTEGELVTPTGAAIAAAIRTSEKLPERFGIRKTGVGAGKRNYERPSLLRAMLIEAEKKEPETTDFIYRLETNLDDCTGEAMGYVMERLLKSGARDVHFIPVYMKKNRPAYELVVICDETKIEELEQIIFRETTTIGIRRMRMERTVLPRETASVQTRYGELKVKKCILPNGEERCYPEYESMAALAKKNGVSFQQILEKF